MTGHDATQVCRTPLLGALIHLAANAKRIIPHVYAPVGRESIRWVPPSLSGGQDEHTSSIPYKPSRTLPPITLPRVNAELQEKAWSGAPQLTQGKGRRIDARTSRIWRCSPEGSLVVRLWRNPVLISGGARPIRESTCTMPAAVSLLL